MQHAPARKRTMFAFLTLALALGLPVTVTDAGLWLAADGDPAARGDGEQHAAQATPGEPPAATTTPTSQSKPPLAPDGMPPEKVEADVSAHQIDVTAAFTGIEIVVFGSVDHSRQTGPEAGIYDVAVILQGPAVAVTARSKSNVGGLWINTGSMLFDAVPSFYAVSTTRPLEEIAEPSVLKQHSIGFDYVRMRPRHGRIPTYSLEDLAAYKDAIIRIKQRDRLYPRQDFGVAFIGRSLFRTSIMLPANVPISALKAHVYLFRGGELLSTYTAPVKLERRGVEAVIYDFARKHAFFYGLSTVLLAGLAGLAAAMIFRRT